MDISQNLQQAITLNTLPPTLVVCLPQIHITSSGMKSTPCLQEIPVNSLEGSLVGKLIFSEISMLNLCLQEILTIAVLILLVF